MTIRQRLLHFGVVLAAAGTVVSGCGDDKWDPKQAPTVAAPAGVAAACPLFTAAEVQTVFGVAGVQTKENSKMEIANSVGVGCTYSKDPDFMLEIMIVTEPAKGGPEEVLKVTVGNGTSEPINGLGDGAAYRQQQMGVGQVITVKNVGSGHVRVVIVTGQDSDKAKMIEATRTLLTRV